MFKMLAIGFFSAALVCACSKSNNGGGTLLGGDGGGKLPGKPGTTLASLNEVDYTSEYCTSKVSGTSNPPQVLLGIKCSYTRYDFILPCTAGDHNCEADVPGGHAQAGFSETYDHYVLVIKNKDGSLVRSESFTCDHCLN